ncbi:MAG: twin-arginine translocase TatA/TatE family subunit [Planctomycetes bacterium]|nr:twin-arginine translocase TatA/TatE family subunit [Planctomycetota bacterium]
MPGGSEWIVILVVALLIFGKRLPEVGKSLGKGIVEFKKGLKGVEDDIDDVDGEIDDAASRKTKKRTDQLESQQHVVGERSKDKAEA